MITKSSLGVTGRRKLGKSTDWFAWLVRGVERESVKRKKTGRRVRSPGSQGSNILFCFSENTGRFYFALVKTLY